MKCGESSPGLSNVVVEQGYRLSEPALQRLHDSRIDFVACRIGRLVMVRVITLCQLNRKRSSHRCVAARTKGMLPEWQARRLGRNQNPDRWEEL